MAAFDVVGWQAGIWPRRRPNKEAGPGRTHHLPMVRPRRSGESRNVFWVNLSRPSGRAGRCGCFRLPGGKEGDDLTVEFTVLGRKFVGLDGGLTCTPNEAVSFMVITKDQEETDRSWDAIVRNGGQESACGWCKDRWGHSWQVTPRLLLELTTSSDRDKARRAFGAMMTMGKIDIATIDAAARV
ncbi:putative 3-demethylubiquinone-9 3-methyltransferase (glyoxalase superfamily) [Aurantimonas endophytica]|uniref:Putative 3-demethylubiquinone-9 3-methyltransferase (Glyoxalase superfamily) n=1 Tax=Aurantimonas endophytica TaxID=1522175 RepID=A0A7W6HFH3_9HYPH|nr:putative 3-demethylubiquinone-9 3-methyltransferase (glyoxalase superfamily) [Aurantimonas endophytica]